MPDLLFSDVSPICSECGCPCDDGYQKRFTGRRESDTGYADEEYICAACLDAEGEYEHADAAYDLRVED